MKSKLSEKERMKRDDRRSRLLFTYQELANWEKRFFPVKMISKKLFLHVSSVRHDYPVAYVFVSKLTRHEFAPSPEVIDT